MACIVTKDPDNAWYIFIDWDEWFDRKIEEIGGTFTITQSIWTVDPALTQTGTTFSATTNQTYVYCTGGVDGNKYNLTNTITYIGSTLAGAVFTEDRTVKVRIKEK